MDQLQEIVYDISRVQECLAQKRISMPSIVEAAITHGAADTLDVLLSEGVDPNLRSDDSSELSDLQPGWSTYEPPLDFDPEDGDGWYPLYRAARPSEHSDKSQHARIITTLLEHEADLYLVFGQTLLPPRESSRSLFPGEDPPRKPETWRPYNEGESKDEDEDENVPWYGFRSVIHAILADGLWVKPILAFPGLPLDLEHRDPQGRTLLLSACRSALGADASIDKSVADVGWDFEHPYYFSPDVFPDPSATETPQQTVLRSLLDLGADPLAIDDNGKPYTTSWRHTIRPGTEQR